MQTLAAAVVLTLLATPAIADVAEAVATTILPGYAAFTQAARDLETAAQDDCAPASLRDDYASAFDAWMGVAHLRFGPAETEGRSLAVAYWPDPKGTGARTMARMIAARDPAVDDPESFARISIAARGLFALERLLYDPQYTGDYACALTRAAAVDLARLAETIETDWREAFAPLLLAPGTEGNSRFLTETEARQALFTQLLTGLEFTADQRLGRPLGTFDRPRPERAEARLSRRSLRNVLLSLEALERLALALNPDSPRTKAGFEKAKAQASGLDPVFADVAQPEGRLKVEILQQTLHALRDTMSAEIGPALGVTVGFNAADGD